MITAISVYYEMLLVHVFSGRT